MSGAMFPANHALPEYLLFVGTEGGGYIAGAWRDVGEGNSFVAGLLIRAGIRAIIYAIDARWRARLRRRPRDFTHGREEIDCVG